MEITTKDRSALKSYFVKNSIPTEQNFEELIDGMLNLKDDGIAKPAGSPLSLEASGNTESQKKAINFYNSFSDDSPDWVLSLNPRGASGQANTAKRGFSIGDADGNSKFFIDKASGNVGIGTTNPGYMLQIESSGANGIYVKGNTSDSAPSVACCLVLESNSDYRGRGMFLPHRESSNTSEAAWFVGVPYTGGGFQIGNSNLMSARASNGSAYKDNAKLFISKDGNVGIGTTSPASKLEVDGEIQAGIAFIGKNSHHTDFACFSHKDHNTQKGFALLQQSDGTTYLNAASGKNLLFRIGNENKMILHSNGKFALGGGTPIQRIIAGRVNSDGSKASGSGFTSTKTATGKYTITFDTAFSAIPVFVATNSGSNDNLMSGNATTSQCTVVSHDINPDTNSVKENSTFAFIAIGI
uniref:Uncharacterized protein n=1 Tax=Candidatus Kentrum sp. UNK TaxID=2126344 RepID=A0A451A141_9GAMM|nr:MAG: hypothetical protein BECKUNK1418G_GA0071005_100854 [Candidatus Kentron sp. UNK]VFK68765.1 MAG: hypothetical protein BECKUNK1418H_GA0071006_10062 [Candidatus Kentron sp. UNK]